MKIPSHSSVSVGGYPVCDGSHQLFVYDRRLDQVGGTALAQRDPGGNDHRVPILYQPLLQRHLCGEGEDPVGGGDLSGEEGDDTPADVQLAAHLFVHGQGGHRAGGAEAADHPGSPAGVGGRQNGLGLQILGCQAAGVGNGVVDVGGGDHAARTAAGEELVETVVVIAIDLRPGHNTFHAVGRHTVAVGGVDIGACEPPVGEETDAVARGEQTALIETEPVLFDSHHTAHILAHRLRRIERRHARPLAREEIFRLPAREALGRIGREIRDALPG